MSPRNSRIKELMSVIGNAFAAAAAVNDGRQPRSRDLRGLGIDPTQFRSIKRYY